ncbi:hypothetical protein P9139_09640 [Curtobacterium flaccumfaciens]|nr:hypothetical protein P9139_09640 [Curtobacterium flaccumfaciens]
MQNWLVASSTKYTNATWIGNVQGSVSLANWPFLQGTTGYSAKFGVGKSMMSYLDQKVGGGALPTPDQAMIGQTSHASSQSSSQSGDQSSQSQSQQKQQEHGGHRNGK